jgi:oligopeptidase B
VDPYAYLSNPDDPATREYIAAEKSYFSTVSRPLRGCREVLYREICTRNPEQDVSVPERIADYWYYTRLLAGREYPVHCRCRKDMGNDEQIYLDENLVAAGKEYFELGAMDLCPRQRWLAYLVDDSGDETYRLLLRDLESGEEAWIAGDAGDSLAWCEDGRTLVYTRVDANGRPHSLCCHRVGSGAGQDGVLLEESDEAFYLSVWKSRSRRFIFIESVSHTTSEIHYLSAAAASGSRCFRRREPDVEYYLDHHDSGFLILTNQRAPNFQLLRTPVDRPHPETWEVLVPQQPQATLEYVEPYANHLLVGELANGNERLRVLDPDGGACRYLDFPEPCYSIDVADLYDYHADYVRVDYSSMVSPPTVFDYRPEDGQRVQRKQDVVRDYRPERYISRRVTVPAADGVGVPVSLFYRGEPEGGGRPCLMLAYGAYGESMDVAFDSDYVSLVDRGVIMALVHVRGGGECGPWWHDAGRLAHKENSFSDFLSCAHYLIEQGFTSAGQIGAWGASAGGLLVAVAAKRAPELFSAAIAEVPFVDLINTLLDRGLPLTVNDLQEFGDPMIAADFAKLMSYAPYENVDGGGMPPLLITAGLHDQRVGFWEPLKWVARMRAARTDGNPIWLKIYNTGHHGESGRYHQHRHTALIFAFLLANWGIPAHGADAAGGNHG